MTMTAEHCQHEPAPSPIPVCADPANLGFFSSSHMCDNANEAWRMQTKGSPLHHCSKDGRGNYTSVKMMMLFCLSSKRWECKGWGRGEKKTKEPCSFPLRGQMSTRKKNSQTYKNTSCLYLGTWLIQCIERRFWPSTGKSATGTDLFRYFAIHINYPHAGASLNCFAPIYAPHANIQINKWNKHIAPAPVAPPAVSCKRPGWHRERRPSLHWKIVCPHFEQM